MTLGKNKRSKTKMRIVPRTAIAKLETDKGLPDVGNLKILARLLNVSVDYLLDKAFYLIEKDG